MLALHFNNRHKDVTVTGHFTGVSESPWCIVIANSNPPVVTLLPVLLLLYNKIADHTP